MLDKCLSRYTQLKRCQNLEEHINILRKVKLTQLARWYAKFDFICFPKFYLTKEKTCQLRLALVYSFSSVPIQFIKCLLGFHSFRASENDCLRTTMYSFVTCSTYIFAFYLQYECEILWTLEWQKFDCNAIIWQYISKFRAFFISGVSKKIHRLRICGVRSFRQLNIRSVALVLL